jgi:uncharacterized protein (DUF433 family)
VETSFDQILQTPIYNMVEAAHYARVPYQTLRYWAKGRDSVPPLIALASNEPPRLSFMNLVECHILSGMRREYNLSIVKVRPALRNLIKLYPSLHPLLDWHFETNRVNLFVREPGDELIDLNNPEQKVLAEILEINIERIERDTKGMYVFYPFVEKRSRQEPKIIMINPAISFGRPVISGTGIPTAVIASRFHARDSIRDLAEEYGRTEKEVEEAIRWESRAIAA